MSSKVKKMLKKELIEYIELLEEEIIQLKDKLKEESELYDHLEKYYEEIVEEKNKEILSLKAKIISKDITLNSYKDKNGHPLIVKGSEKELYAGEQKDLILHLLEQYRGDNPNVRRYHVCDSILKANKKVGTRDIMQKNISSALRCFSCMDKETIRLLEEANIKIISSKNHHKLSLNGDSRYRVSISKTPSDARTGPNCISECNRHFF